MYLLICYLSSNPLFLCVIFRENLNSNQPSLGKHYFGCNHRCIQHHQVRRCMPACATWGCVCLWIFVCVRWWECVYLQLAYVFDSFGLTQTCIWASDGVVRVCVCVCVVSGYSPTAAPVGHLSSQAYQQGGCNLAANLIIQIAESLMLLNQKVKKKEQKSRYYLFTRSIV